jgi:hypothetical protein
MYGRLARLALHCPLYARYKKKRKTWPKYKRLRKKSKADKVTTPLNPYFSAAKI